MSATMPEPHGGPASISVLELSPYHHEVVVAFCAHVLSVGINIRLLLPRKGGLGKTLFGIAAKSYQELKDIAAANNLVIPACRAVDEEALASLINATDSLFIATLPKFGTATGKTYARTKLDIVLIDQLRHRLSTGRRTYVTIHKPHEEIPRLTELLSPEQLRRIFFVALSAATKAAIGDLLSTQACRVLVMPAVSRPASPAASADQPGRLTFVIPGEISTRRRDYNQLCQLAPLLKAVGNHRLQVQILGRLKKETWLDKLLFPFPFFPASLIFLLRHPRLLGLSRQGFLDLSRVKKRKLNDMDFSAVLESCSAILDIQQSHYDHLGITSGLVGLSLTHAKPALRPEKLRDLLILGAHDNLTDLRRQLIAQSAELAVHREILTDAFRREIAKDFRPAQTPQRGRDHLG